MNLQSKLRFHFSFEKRRIVKELGDRRRCMDEVYIKEMIDLEQGVGSGL